MKFSILVPVYNVEKYLEQCVESLLNQTYKGDYEIILVDDGSTDSSGAICDRFKENNPDKVKVIHKENGGHTSARLAAINNAIGEYCLFSDSDDFVESDLLEAVASVLNQNHGTDMVIYSFSYYEDSIKIPRNMSAFEKEEIFEGDKKKKLYELLITTPYINSLWTKAVRTEIIKNSNINYDALKDKDIAEDAYIVSHFVTDCKKIVYTDKPLYNYRTNRKSISRSYNSQKIEGKNTLFLYYHFKSCLSDWKMNTEEYRQKLNARWLNEVMYTFSMYYENVSASDRKVVLNYDWSSMLPQEVADGAENRFENPISRKLYNFIKDKRYFRLKLHFTYKRLYKNYRQIKSRLMNK